MMIGPDAKEEQLIIQLDNINTYEIFVHENYRVAAGSKANDIALLRLGDLYWSKSI